MDTDIVKELHNPGSRKMVVSSIIKNGDPADAVLDRVFQRLGSSGIVISAVEHLLPLDKASPTP